MHGNMPGRFFTKEEKDTIRNAIQEAEKNTSGEIRVHLLRSFKKGAQPLESAKRIFEKLGMTATAQRNGVLFLLELKQHQLVILGDQGIDQKVPEHFWEDVRDRILAGFALQKFAEGLVGGIRMAGEKLKEYFPYQDEDLNELPDEISFGEE